MSFDCVCWYNLWISFFLSDLIPHRMKAIWLIFFSNAAPFESFDVSILKIDICVEPLFSIDITPLNNSDYVVRFSQTHHGVLNVLIVSPQIRCNWEFKIRNFPIELHLIWSGLPIECSSYFTLLIVVRGGFFCSVFHMLCSPLMWNVSMRKIDRYK